MKNIWTFCNKATKYDPSEFKEEQNHLHFLTEDINVIPDMEEIKPFTQSESQAIEEEKIPLHVLTENLGY